MSKIDLLLDEENELTFQLNVEGNSPGAAQCRLKLAGENMDLLFEANSHESGEISVVLPPLSHVLKEGDYDMSLEVIVDDKFFKPLTITGTFEKSVKVTAEAVVRKPKKPAVSVTASFSEKESKSPITVKNSRTKNQVLSESKKKKSISDSDILRLIDALQKKKT